MVPQGASEAKPISKWCQELTPDTTKFLDYETPKNVIIILAKSVGTRIRAIIPTESFEGCLNEKECRDDQPALAGT